MKENKKKLFILALVITGLILTFGISYAYFTANLTGGEEETTLTVTGGTMNIVYNGGSTISVFNIIPSNDPVVTKIFTVTGNSTTDLNMEYKLSLIIVSNTFSDDALKYKLISTNNGLNGNVVSSISDLQNIGTGSKTIVLGIGEFYSPTEGNKVHTYNLELYFPEEDYNQNIDQDKQIEAYIKIDNAQSKNIIGDILANNGGITEIEGKETPDFSETNVISGIYSVDDQYGTSYYYRGVKTELNNNIIWGGFQWKIIRINGDNSLRLIYNGNENQFNNTGTMNDLGSNTQISSGIWNDNYMDSKYTGYMYGGANGEASTQRNGNISSSATYNETSTSIKNVLDSWYQNNILGKVFESDVVNNLFCNDRQLSSEVGGPATGPGYGNLTTYYAAYQRLYVTKNPNLKCELANDRFTSTTDQVIGNGVLKYPIGLISADEASLAGLVISKNNTENYLYNNEFFWTISPNYMSSESGAVVYVISSSGGLSNGSVRAANGIRPVISIKGDINVIGTGTLTDPYRVV